MSLSCSTEGREDNDAWFRSLKYKHERQDRENFANLVRCTKELSNSIIDKLAGDQTDLDTAVSEMYQAIRDYKGWVDE